jgi:hypothetical protein
MARFRVSKHAREHIGFARAAQLVMIGLQLSPARLDMARPVFELFQSGRAMPHSKRSRACERILRACVLECGAVAPLSD